MCNSTFLVVRSYYIWHIYQVIHLFYIVDGKETCLIKRKNWLAKHAKSSVALISLGIHILLILVAISFVAVTVIQKEDQKFEAKQVKRPSQKLRKLKVPMKANKKKPKPKLRKRLVVKNVKRNTPEFQLPEITGVKGGIRVMDGGMETIGFSMPELDFLGQRLKAKNLLLSSLWTSHTW